jgi:hypothetical protein
LLDADVLGGAPQTIGFAGASPQFRRSACVRSEVLGADAVGQAQEYLSVRSPGAVNLGFGHMLCADLVDLFRDAHDAVNHAQVVPVVQDEVADAVLGVDLLPEGDIR